MLFKFELLEIGVNNHFSLYLSYLSIIFYSQSEVYVVRCAGVRFDLNNSQQIDSDSICQDCSEHTTEFYQLIDSTKKRRFQQLHRSIFCGLLSIFGRIVVLHKYYIYMVSISNSRFDKGYCVMFFCCMMEI